MTDSEVKIKIPETNTTVSSSQFENEARGRFEKIDQILFAVIASVVISAIASIVAVLGLFIDQFRYNNAAYKEYSMRIESAQKSQAANNEFLKENRRNQQIIIDQQKQIQDLIEGKNEIN